MDGRSNQFISRHIVAIALFTGVLALVGCGNLPFIGSLPIIGSGPAAPTPSRQITYEGAVTLNVQAGKQLAGTGVVYQGKAPDGRAIVMIDGLQGLKSTADSVRWSGALVLFSLVELNLRVVTYDESSMNLAGTIRIVVQEPNPVPADPAKNPMAAFTIPLTYTINKGGVIPGTNVTYDGAESGGAKFQNLDQIPYVNVSILSSGKVACVSVSVRYELRLLDFNDDRAILGGTAQIIFEP